MDTRSSLCRLAFCMALFAPSAAVAALPLITDDAGTVGKGTFQLEINAQYDHDRADGVTTTGGQVDPIFSYGLTDSVDLVVIPSYLWVDQKSATSRSSENGLSDTTVEVKWRFYENDGLSFAVKPGLNLPTGDSGEGLGAGKLGGHLYLLGTMEIGPWSFSANLGYIRNENDSDSDERNIWHTSVAAIYTMNDRWKIAADLVAERNTAKDDDNNPVEALAGVIFSLTKDIDLDLGIKRGITSSATDWSLLSGATFRF